MKQVEMEMVASLEPMKLKAHSPKTHLLAIGAHSTPTPYTLHPTPYTLHPTPYTLHPTPYTPHPTPYTPRCRAKKQQLKTLQQL